MTDTKTRTELFAALGELAEIIPDMRGGQVMAAVGELCADLHGRGLWDATAEPNAEADRGRHLEQTRFEEIATRQKEQNGARKMAKHRIYTTSFASVYPHYVAKAEKKGRTKAEVDRIIRWLTGYSQKRLDSQIKKQTDFESFFAEAPQLNPSRTLITGVICGVRVEDIKESTMREIRYLDKMVDELAKGKAIEKILRE